MILDSVAGIVYATSMSLIRAILKRIVDTEAIMAEIERQANAWMGE